MREEYELEVLEHYDIEVKGTRRMRGAFFCDTDKGTMLLKETKISGRRALLLYTVLSCLEERENVKVDTPVFTRDKELLVTSREGTKYMLKKWYQGRECDIRQEEELFRSARTLALLHGEMEQAVPQKERGPSVFPAGKDPEEEIRRHNRELKKVRSFIRGRVVKNEFEYLFLDSFDKMYQMAEKVSDRLERSGCAGLYRESLEQRSTIHGDYNYHNLLIFREGGDMAVTNFEHMRVDIQARDLCYFLRKAMEKHRWKQKTGRKILEAYESVRTLKPEEREYIGLSLAYPEKFWKTASSYYHSNKAWLPEKCVEKLELSVRQSEEKYDFLETIFSLNL